MAKKDVVYFTISQAAKMLGVSPSSLRAWEHMRLIKPVRSQGRYRLYSQKDLSTAKRIVHLSKNEGLNLAGIAHLLRNTKPSADLKLPQRPKQVSSVSEQLLRLRRLKGSTLSDIARRTQLSISFLSALERGLANPSIATLQRLAVAYDTNVLSMFGVGDEKKVQRLIRPADRKVLRPHPGVQMELLALGRLQMEAHIFRIAPGASSGGSYHHEGEEFIHVLEGSVEVWLDEVEYYVLKKGDTLYFESTRSHRWKSLSESETVLLWVNTPPTF